MIRFSAALVVVAVGVLIGGVATSTLSLVYVAIVLSALALIALAIGVALKRDELFGVTGQPVEDVMGAAAGQSAPGVQRGGYPAPSSYVRGMGAPAPGPAVPVAPPAPAMPVPAPVAPSVPAPAASGPAGVADTRSDLAAYRADVPEKAEKKPGPGLDQTRLDLSPVLANETAAPIVGPTAAEETRFDLPAARPEGTTGPEKAAPGVPLPVPEEGRSAADETRFDLPAARSPGSATDTPPAAADETRFDLPAQPPASAQPPAPAQPQAPAQPPAPASSAGPAAPAGSASGTKAAAGDTQVAIIPGVPRYHAPNCILIRFMEEEELEKMTLDEAKAAGCTPCTACQSDPSTDTATD
ncbi:MAG TPA: hypothetical protein VF060_31625 [Trebonia sp.]